MAKAEKAVTSQKKDDAKERTKILIVDDDKISLSIAEAILKNNHEIKTAKSGEGAIYYLYHGYFPDLILLDILMPKMDGWETFNRIRAISYLQDIPVAFLTSINETADKELARKIGAADFISKPYDSTVLLKRIDKIINESKTTGKDRFSDDIRELLLAYNQLNDTGKEAALGALRGLINIFPNEDSGSKKA
jgi:CheY-like chemotaxis protein